MISIRSCTELIFGEDLAQIDFQNTKAARTQINQWVERQTQGNIKEFLPRGNNDELLLVNAASFNGKWENKFNRTETRVGVFYSSASVRNQAIMMSVVGTFNHGE